jgi:hypothetical protein
MTVLSINAPSVPHAFDDHQRKSRDAQRAADRWMLPGAVMMTTAILGPIGFPLFLKGMSMQRKAEQPVCRYVR